MPIINKVPYKKININLQGAIGIPSTDSNILLIGHRSGVLSGAMPNYNQLQPKSGYPQLTAYRSYNLPSFDSGDSAISYMKALGFTANYGLSNNLTFPAPNKVTMPASEITKDKTKFKKLPEDNTAIATLQWDSIPTGFDLLIGSNKEITITQTNVTKDVSNTATAKVQSVKQNPSQLVLADVQGIFTNTAQITVNYIDSDVNVPDPERTDEICMMVYYAVNSINSNFPPTINTITPTVSICFLNPDDSGFAPSNEAIRYLNKDGSNAVISNVEKLSNGNTALYFATTPANFGVTPLTALVNTLVSKDVSNNGTLVCGTLVQVLPGITSDGVGIELKDIAGAFTVGDIVNITLDSSQDVFSLLVSAKQYPISPYEITSEADIVSPTSKFVPLFNYLNKANAPTSVNNGSFFAMGIVANISTPKQQAGSLPVFDTGPSSPFGAEYITGAYYPYIRKLGDYPLTAAMVASSYAGIIACNDIPFN
ncbi:MAG: hypothetical protein ACK5XF_05580, partial [Neisseriaceae bacterium]